MNPAAFPHSPQLCPDVLPRTCVPTPQDVREHACCCRPARLRHTRSEFCPRKPAVAGKGPGADPGPPKPRRWGNALRVTALPAPVASSALGGDLAPQKHLALSEGLTCAAPWSTAAPGADLLPAPCCWLSCPALEPLYALEMLGGQSLRSGRGK